MYIHKYLYNNNNNNNNDGTLGSLNACQFILSSSSHDMPNKIGRSLLYSVWYKQELFRPKTCTYLLSRTTFIHSYIHTFIHSYIHTFIHSYIHTFIHSYIHTFIHSYIHTFIHTKVLQHVAYRTVLLFTHRYPRVVGGLISDI